MFADFYTKVVLTVIAICLVVIVFRDTSFVKQAFAQSGPVRVIISDVDQFAFQYVTLKVRESR